MTEIFPKPTAAAPNEARDVAAGAGREAYYAPAQSWALDRQEAQGRSRRLAWILAAVATTIAGLEALALVALAPLKTTVPYTVLVDRNTGFAQALEAGKVPDVAPQTALTQSLLAQYVLAREAFDIATISQQYHKVALWSSGSARVQYLAQMQSSGADNPVHRFARGAVLAAEVESVSPLGPQAALVRFVTTRQDQAPAAAGAAGVTRRAYWVAVVRYRFSGEPMALADRLINPLGFQVESYRRDQEAPPVIDASAASAIGTTP